jgi:hypothetical protein
VPQHRHYCRSKAVGLAHRAKLRAWIVPRLQPGCRVPTADWLSHFLRIHASEAYRHMRRVLAEDGIATETRRAGRGQRIYVVSLPERRAAA